MECRVPGVDGPGVGGPGPRGRGPGHFHVAHGEDYFDAANCRTCECKDGNATALCRYGEGGGGGERGERGGGGGGGNTWICKWQP